jgi:plastocyanin
MGHRVPTEAKRAVLAAAAGLIALAASPALAGGLSIRVVDAAGKPVADAVVTLRPQGEAPPAPRIGSGYRVAQQNRAFVPHISIVPVNASVAFPNLDPFKHHVYSFSPAKRFELKLFARNEMRSITFDRPGIIAVGCNIHDSMSAYIYVTDTVWSQQTGTGGQAAFRDTPSRNFTLSVWHPLLRAPGNTVSSVLPASGQDRSQTVTVRLRPVMNHGSHGY